MQNLRPKFFILVLGVVVAMQIASAGDARAHWNYCSTGSKIKHSTPDTTYWYPDSWGGKYTSATSDAANLITNNTRFSYYYTNGGNHEFTWHKDDYGKTGWDGLSSISYTSDCRIYDGDMYYNVYYTSGYSEAKTQSVAIHEHGHGMGMNHFTDSCSLKSFMQAKTACRWDQLGVNYVTAHDKDDVNATY